MVLRIPEVEYLEKVSSSEEPSPEGAWWITLQIVEHLINSISQRDKRTFSFLPHLMTDFLERYAELLKVESIRPLPNDMIQFLVENSLSAANHILKNPRSKMVKETVMVSSQKLKSPSTKTMNWMAKQPGRTVKEKVGPRNKVLTQVNRFSYDTKENQLTIKYLQEMKKIIEDRFENGINKDVYDLNEQDGLRNDQMETFMKFIQSIKKSELAYVKPKATYQANNVLLSDKYYSIIWRSYQELVARRHRIEENWKFAFLRFVKLLYMGLAATFAEKKEFQVIDRVMEVHDENGFISFEINEDEKEQEIEFIIQEKKPSYQTGIVQMINKEKQFGFIHGSDGHDYFLHASGLLERSQFDLLNNGHQVYFLTKESKKGPQAIHVFMGESLCILKMKTNKRFIELSLSHQRLNQSKAVFEEISYSTLLYQFKEDVEANQERSRGIFFTSYVAKTDHNQSFEKRRESYADMKGIYETISDIIHDVEKWTKMNFHEKEQDPTPTKHAFETLAFDFMTMIPRLQAEKSVDLKERLFSVQFHQNEQLYQPKKDSSFAFNQEVIPLNSILFNYNNKQSLALSSFKTILDHLSNHVALEEENYFIYTIPDSIDEFSQKDVKLGFHLSFKQNYPVWRSIAAAMSVKDKLQLKDDQSLLVIDTHDDESNAVLLKVIYNHRYQDFFFQHYAPYSVDDDEHEINLSYFIQKYLFMFLEKYHVDIEPQQTEALLNSGIIEKVVIDQKSTVIPIELDDKRTAVKMFFDAEIYQRLSKKWTRHIGEYLRDLKQEGTKQQKMDHVLVVADHMTENRDNLLKFKNFLDVRSVHFLKTKEVLLGANEINQSLIEKRPTWYEFLPNLSLEVIKGGHYDQLSLIEDESIENVMGEEKEFQVKEILTLEKGHKHYDFPLIKGSSSKNNIEFQARIMDESFPLQDNLNVNLSVKYRYGYENSYKLVVTPADGEHSIFKSIVADWVEEAGNQSKSMMNHFPAFPLKPLSSEEFEVALNNFKKFLGYLEFLISKIQNGKGTSEDLSKMEDQIYRRIFLLRSLVATRNKIFVHEVVKFYQGSLVKYMINISRNTPEYLNNDENDMLIQKLKNTSLIFLSSFGPYVADEIFDFVLNRYLNEKDLTTSDRIQKYKAYGSLLCLNSHRNEVLEKIIEAFSNHKNLVISYALRIPIWNDRELIHKLYEKDPTFITSLIKEIKIQFKRSYFSNFIDKNRFRDYCELLLAILRLRERENFTLLQIGSMECRTLAKYIRKLDATLFKKDWTLQSRLKFQLNKPDALANMSDLAYACNLYLTGEKGVNLIQVSDIEEME